MAASSGSAAKVRVIDTKAAKRKLAAAMKGAPGSLVCAPSEMK